MRKVIGVTYEKRMPPRHVSLPTASQDIDWKRSSLRTMPDPLPPEPVRRWRKARAMSWRIVSIILALLLAVIIGGLMFKR